MLATRGRHRIAVRANEGVERRSELLWCLIVNPVAATDTADRLFIANDSALRDYPEATAFQLRSHIPNSVAGEAEVTHDEDAESGFEFGMACEVARRQKRIL